MSKIAMSKTLTIAASVGEAVFGVLYGMCSSAETATVRSVLPTDLTAYGTISALRLLSLVLGVLCWSYASKPVSACMVELLRSWWKRCRYAGVCGKHNRKRSEFDNTVRERRATW